MRTIFLVLVIVALGCGKQRSYDGPTVDTFVGQLTHEGKPVSFSEKQKPKLRLILHKGAQRFGIPIKPDGTFEIGWMPIGEYSAFLETRNTEKGKTQTDVYHIKKGLTIEKGQTQYQVELGADYKP